MLIRPSSVGRLRDGGAVLGRSRWPVPRSPSCAAACCAAGHPRSVNRLRRHVGPTASRHARARPRWNDFRLSEILRCCAGRHRSGDPLPSAAGVRPRSALNLRRSAVPLRRGCRRVGERHRQRAVVRHCRHCAGRHCAGRHGCHRRRGRRSPLTDPPRARGLPPRFRAGPAQDLRAPIAGLPAGAAARAAARRATRSRLPPFHQITVPHTITGAGQPGAPTRARPGCWPPAGGCRSCHNKKRRRLLNP
jgi:hypothetical protein